MLGQKVVTLVDKTQKAGYYSKDWDISNSNIYASGVYVLRLMVSGIDKSRYVKSKKIILMK